MKFVLFRHAQKGLTPYADPGLTTEGFQQAEVLNELVKQKIIPTPTQVWVSPKIRTTQTMKPICEENRINLQVTDLLDLRNGDETLAGFRERIQKFLNSFESETTSAEVHFACTHYDFIEEAMTLINSDKDLKSFEFSHWPPGQYIVFEIFDGLWKYVQKGAPNLHKGNHL